MTVGLFAWAGGPFGSAATAFDPAVSNPATIINQVVHRFFGYFMNFFLQLDFQTS
jgi:hypothetical protein